MGLVPLSYTEINAYIQSTNTPLSGDEVLLIRELSEIYCSYSNNKNPTLQSPFNK